MTDTSDALDAPWSAERLEALVADFERARVPRAEWTHRAHVAVAAYELHRHGPVDGARRIVEGIQQLNAANGVAQTPTGGYHETITQLYIRVLGRFVADLAPTDDAVAVVNAAWAALGDARLPLRFYSRERLMSWEARTGWVEPDRAPLP